MVKKQYRNIHYTILEEYVGDVDLLGENAVFKSRIGLSSVPSGVLCIQYGDEMLFGLARKKTNANMVKAFWKIGNDDGANGWSEL